MIQDQIAIIGTTEPLRESVVATEAPGLVVTFLVKAGDFVFQGTPLAVLGSKDLRLQLKRTRAAYAAIQSRLVLAEKELQRVDSLKRTNSISEKQYDEAFHSHSVLKSELLMNSADIDQLEYEISQKKVLAPYSGYIAAEHTQVGQWVHTGGPVVTLVDMSRILIKVDVPESYAVNINTDSMARVTIDSLSKKPISIEVIGYHDNDAAVQGDLDSGQLVVIRGNERLRPGQQVKVLD